MSNLTLSTTDFLNMSKLSTLEVIENLKHNILIQKVKMD